MMPTAAARLLGGVSKHLRESSSPSQWSRAAAVGPQGSRVWLWLAGAVVIALALPISSTLLGLYDRIQHWGKVVHGLEGFLATIAVGLLLLAWRDRENI